MAVEEERANERGRAVVVVDAAAAVAAPQPQSRAYATVPIISTNTMRTTTTAHHILCDYSIYTSTRLPRDPPPPPTQTSAAAPPPPPPLLLLQASGVLFVRQSAKLGAVYYLPHAFEARRDELRDERAARMLQRR